MENNNLKHIKKDNYSNEETITFNSLKSSIDDKRKSLSVESRIERYSKMCSNYFENEEISCNSSNLNYDGSESVSISNDIDKKNREEEKDSLIKKDEYSQGMNTDFISLDADSSEKKGNLKKKNSTHQRIRFSVFMVSFLIFLSSSVFCIYNIFNWLHDNHDTKQIQKQIEEITQVSEVEDNSNTELVNQPEERKSDYWYYVNFPLIQVDFQELLKKNKDTVAWIQVNNTNINYPVVQTTDNNYYLNHSYDNSVNEAGWVFMDFRNTPDFSFNNTILYAHSRLDKSMFGSLSRILKSDWYENKENHIIKVSTPIENTLWQIFSVYKIKEESYYITTSFTSDNTYQEFLNTIQSRSKYDFHTELTTDDHVLTLSTCYSDTERTVVHAKLIKRAKR